MAVILGVSVPISSRLHCCVSRAKEIASSRFASFSSGAHQDKEISIHNRSCNGVGLEHIASENSGRILGRNWKGRTRRISSAADLSGLSGCSVGVGGRQVSPVEEEVGVMEGDVVEYPLTGGAGVGQEDKDSGRRRVGVIVDMRKDSDVLLCQIEPLCQEDPGSKEWIHDESEPEITVPIGQVRVLQAWYSQRMVPDRISNPHGEHAENLWILE